MEMSTKRTAERAELDKNSNLILGEKTIMRKKIKEQKERIIHNDKEMLLASSMPFPEPYLSPVFRR